MKKNSRAMISKQSKEYKELMLIRKTMLKAAAMLEEARSKILAENGIIEETKEDSDKDEQKKTSHLIIQKV